MKEVNKFNKHLDEYVHERETKLRGILFDAGLTFEVLSKVKKDSVILLKILKAAGISNLADCINIIAAVQEEDRTSFEKVLHIRAFSPTGVKDSGALKEASVELVMTTASKLEPHTQTDRGTCPGEGI
jgi:hypothetical protein